MNLRSSGGLEKIKESGLFPCTHVKTYQWEQKISIEYVTNIEAHSKLRCILFIWLNLPLNLPIWTICNVWPFTSVYFVVEIRKIVKGRIYLSSLMSIWICFGFKSSLKSTYEVGLCTVPVHNAQFVSYSLDSWSGLLNPVVWVRHTVCS